MKPTPRDEIKKIIKEFLAAKLSAKAKGIDPQLLDETVESRAETLLTKLEETFIFQRIKEHFGTSFWYGVGQSIVGGVLMFFVIGLLILTIYGFRFNFWEATEKLAKDINESKRIEQKK